jgi:hypothetical protein
MDLRLSEEAKRERHWDARLRWQVLQQTITWAEAQATVRRNTPAACLREQQRKLAALAARAPR